MRTQQSFLDRLRKSWWFAWLAAVLLTLTHLKDATEGVEKLMVIFKLKPDALAIADSADKGAFAREFSEVAWRRLFWAQAFIGRIEANQSPQDIEDAYKAYVSATEVWHSKLMNFILLTERFHGEDRARRLETEVAVAMNKVTALVSALRFPESAKPLDFKSAHESIDEANTVLYGFIRGT